MMAAMRAMPSTSPFFAVPDSMMASVSGFMRMVPVATAMRWVSFLPPTSTICAWPVESKWVRPSLAGADCGSDFLLVMVRRMQTGTIAVSGYHSTRDNEIVSFLFFSAVGAGTAGMAICCDGDAGRFYAAGVAV